MDIALMVCVNVTFITYLQCRDGLEQQNRSHVNEDEVWIPICVVVCLCAHLPDWEQFFKEKPSVHEHIQVAVCLHVHENVSRDCAAANLLYRPHSNTHSHTCCDGCCSPAELSSRPQLPLCHYAIWQLQMVWELHTRVLLFHPAGPSCHKDEGVWQQGKDPSGAM